MCKRITRGGEVVTHQAHNLKIGGANPSPASKFIGKLMEIKDYCKVYNVIPKNICTKIIKDYKDDANWKEHTWYSVTDNTIESNHNKELDILLVGDLDYIRPYIVQIISEYMNNCAVMGSVTRFTELRLNKYSKGTTMSTHVDLIRRNQDEGVPVLSLVLVFNDNFEGGEFMMNDEEIKLKQGDILVFPSTFLYRHSVKEVTKGTRYSGVSWVY